MKVMVVFGTRPEAIKMCPVVKELEKHKEMETVVCVTGQHKEMLWQVLDVFEVTPKYNLDIMKSQQTLSDITVAILNEIQSVLNVEKPNLVLVHGDTTTAYVSALACFYRQIPVGHVEAGLRTYDLYSPFPEEYNRQSIDMIAKFLFAPTEDAKLNLLRENKNESNIYVTGNTVIDALKTTVNKCYHHTYLEWAKGSKLILLTAHRRENTGHIMESIFRAVRRLVDENMEIKVIFPVHPNPVVQKKAKQFLGGNERIKLVDPLNVVEFHNFMASCYLILTDSGGVQEEASAFGKPVLVMRDTTERLEGVRAGSLKLVGTKGDSIYKECQNLLCNEKEYRKMVHVQNPFGDGRAAERIVNVIIRSYKNDFTG